MANVAIRTGGRPKRSWKEIIEKDKIVLHLTVMTFNRIARKGIV